ncbi:MAG: bifunctional aspartate kinase/homoserine dehydrogenase I, partial [SAR324 cluster bacterium]|nr:bifunctional aspartate kinase/homoserine dehydrogenase I [SAR324 cluster bacterium]
MKVLKFGGASVGNAEKIKRLIGIVRDELFSIRAVVASAFDGVTDTLIAASQRAAEGDESFRDLTKTIEERHVDALKALIPVENRAHVTAQVKTLIHELEDILKGAFLVRECTARTKDYVMSFGERLSCLVISEAFKAEGVENELLDARNLIVTDKNFGTAQVLSQKTEEKIREYFSTHKSLQIVTGFIGATENGEVTTLGRGGSDYTAAIIGAELGVDEIEIWTDVDGVMTADPRYVPRALSVSAMTYEEAMELSHFGAKVIYPPTIQPAYKKGIPLRIRNSFNVNFPGTLISSEPVPQSVIVTGISSIDQIALMRVEGTGMIGVAGVARRVFSVLAQNKINIILITQASSEHTICFAVLPERAEEAKMALLDEFSIEIERGLIDGVVLEDDLCVISAVGENMRHTPGIGGRLFSSLGRNGVNVVAIAQGSSELSISIVVQRKDQKKALQSIHDEFFLSDVKAVHLFLVGKGRVGATLLNQLDMQREILKNTEALDLKLVGLADSKQMFFDERGINFNDAVEQIKSGDPVNMESFVATLCEMNLPHNIFVDTTASSEIPKYYSKLLSKSISIASPNKHSVAGPMRQYGEIKDFARRRRAFFLYETCVGAGLPVISTLNDLLKSGDRVIRVDAVVSGTLSYLFNSFSRGRKFSEVLKEAHNLGFTEPDPREDLSGFDVARKLLILAREIGYDLELEDVEVESLVPESCKKAESTEEFFELLENEDGYFEKKLENASLDGKRLCYIASLEGKCARTELTAIGSEHPFYGLSGSDNIIAFTTQRYNKRPLVVKGPGAGPDVTAA